MTAAERGTSQYFPWQHLKKGANVMTDYEIRIFKADGTPSLIAVESHFVDQAAIRSARMMADKNPCEVWRDVECIWRSSELRATRKWSKAAARRQEKTMERGEFSGH